MKPTKPTFSITKKTTTTITFEDHGQDFLEWDIVNGIVTDCRPCQASVWIGVRVLNRRLGRGVLVRVQTKGAAALTMNYPIVKVRKRV